MNLSELLKFLPLVVGLSLAFYIIKQYTVDKFSIWQLLLYFLGIIITFVFVGWFVDYYLIDWINDRLATANSSPEYLELEYQTKEIINDAFSPSGSSTTSSSPPQAPNTTTSSGGSSTTTIIIVPTHTPPAAGGGVPESSMTSVTTQATQYTVVAGDTLFGIAKRYNVTVNDIMVANGLMTHTIQPGQVLIIPAPTQ